MNARSTGKVRAIVEKLLAHRRVSLAVWLVSTSMVAFLSWRLGSAGNLGVIDKVKLAPQKRIGLDLEAVSGQAEHYEYLARMAGAQQGTLRALALKSAEDLRRWQGETRSGFRQRLLFPYEAAPQMVAVQERDNEGALLREWHAKLQDKVLFRFFELGKHERDGVASPVLIFYQGHGNVEQLLSEESGYQRAAGKYFAALGYHVYVMENVAMGPQDAADAHLHLDSLLSLEGHGWYTLLFSHQDALLNHVVASNPPGVPIGVAGVSTGGLLALVSAALNERVTSASVHGIFASTADSFGRDYAHHCPCGSIDGLLPEFDLPALALLVAPRPLHINNNQQDSFPPQDAKRALVQIEPMRSLLGGPAPIFTSPPGKHSFALVEAKSFLAETLVR